MPLSEQVTLRRAFIAGYRSLLEERPEEVEQVATAVRRYEAELERHDLRDDQVVANHSAGAIARFVVRNLWLALIRLPLGLVGVVVHWLPFQAASWAGRRLPETEDRLATYKVIASMVFYPLTWLALAIGAGWNWGLPAGLLVMVLGPWSAGVALRLYLRSRLVLGRLRAFWLMHSGKPQVAELRRLRSEAFEAIERLVSLYEDRG